MPLITIYYWRQGFVLLAPSFVLDRSKNPYRRLSATLMYASKAPFMLETGEADSLVARAALIAPKVPRRRIVAINSDLLICDLAVVTPEFNALAPLLGAAPVRELDASAFVPLQAELDRMHRGELPAGELQSVIGRMVFAVTGQHPASLPLHPKIAHALQLIDDFPMRTVTLPWLAERVHLSPSRLRHVFTEQVGSSLTHYLRWTAIWKGVWLWARGTPLIEVAEQVGFHDLAHVNRAFNEIFGLNPSFVLKPDQVRPIRCEWT
ncbi:MAG: AraC family transcriptional regulator [Sinimarinibacterium sp.]